MTTFAGYGLHGGAPSTLRFVREPGAVRLRTPTAEARIAELLPDGGARATVVTTRDRRLRVATVEHVFSALGALAIRDGVTLLVDGPEMPIVDGGAAAFIDALVALDVGHAPPPLRIVRGGTITVGDSVYVLTPPERPSAGTTAVEVTVDFGDARLDRHARWDGDASDFRARIAPARTFGFERELAEILARGLAAHVLPESVVLVGEREILSAGRPFAADEPARHKLLDLVGDLYVHGGPCHGTIHATRPGHAATHEAMRRGLADGLLMLTRTR